MNHTVLTTAHQPVVEYNRPEPAVGGRVPDRMEDPRVDKDAVALSHPDVFISRGEDSGALDQNGQLQLIVPVPGQLKASKIIVITGNGPGGSAVTGQLPAVAVDDGQTFRSLHTHPP